jgi:hypothetical protein
MNGAPSRRLLAALLLLAAGSASAPAGVIDSILENFHNSEFAFGRTDGYAPFPPLAWVDVRDHGESSLSLNGQPVRFDESSMSQFLLGPLWIGQKDMILAGEYAAWQRIGFNAPVVAQRDVYTFMPVFAWLRQTGPRRQVGAFISPEYSHGADYAGHEFAEWSGYAGAIGVNWTSDSFAWAYGGVVAWSADRGLIFPYLGCYWQPTPHWSVAAIAPWPSVSYAPSRDYMFQAGLSPADATLASAPDGSLNVSYTSWNLLFSAHRRLTHNFWISASVGWAGLGNFAVSTDGHTDTDYQLRRDVVWSLQIAFRPPTKGPALAPPLPR